MPKGTVLKNEKLAENTYKIVYKTNLKKALPGQFVSILVPDKVLRRPFSISAFENGKITNIYRVIGEGTEYIKSLQPGCELDFIGALGSGFKFAGKKSALLIGAGIGIAPMFFLKGELDKAKIKNYFISGFKTANEAVLGADKTVIGGSVLDCVPDLINKFCPDVIYCCGPFSVLKLTCQIGAKYKIETQLAMEKVMACGIGVCRGCVIKLKNGKNASVCKDGAVFYGEDIKWD